MMGHKPHDCGSVGVKTIRRQAIAPEMTAKELEVRGARAPRTEMTLLGVEAIAEIDVGHRLVGQEDDVVRICASLVPAKL